VEIDQSRKGDGLLHASIDIREHTHVAEVRRAALALAPQVSFDEVTAGNLGLLVTEAATNMLKHAGGGQVILRTLGEVGIEMLALDKGPGIADVQRCFQDGYSSRGTAGTGLGAIVRLSSVHDIYSRRDQGTALMAQIWKRGHNGGPRVPPPRFRYGGVSVALAGQDDCGDSWLFQEGARIGRVTVADGLGHGLLAADASRAAIRTALEQPDESGHGLMERIHGALRSTRGAAVAVAEIDPPSRVVHFVGVGNIGAAIVPRSGPLRHLVSHSGTAGHEVRKIAKYSSPWDSGSLLLMYSDGLQSHWSLDHYPGLLERHPSLIAGVLYRDYGRDRDDVTVVAAQEARLEL
jgi:anti-sigma regulatory factor (Ser/Thr protein kinase)